MADTEGTIKLTLDDGDLESRISNLLSLFDNLKTSISNLGFAEGFEGLLQGAQSVTDILTQLQSTADSTFGQIGAGADDAFGQMGSAAQSGYDEAASASSASMEQQLSNLQTLVDAAQASVDDRASMESDLGDIVEQVNQAQAQGGQVDNSAMEDQLALMESLAAASEEVNTTKKEGSNEVAANEKTNTDATTAAQELMTANVKTAYAGMASDISTSQAQVTQSAEVNFGRIVGFANAGFTKMREDDIGASAEIIANYVKMRDEGTNAFATLQKQVQELTAALEQSQKQVQELTTKVEQFGKISQEAGAKSKTAFETGSFAAMNMGFMMDALGLKGGMLLGNIGFLAQSIKSMEISPELLAGFAAIAIAIGVITTGFSQLKDAIGEASDTENQMVSITALIKNQIETLGTGSWEALSKGTEDYAESLAKVSGLFSKSDFLNGMRQMLTYGMSVNDMLHSQAAAQDLAAAKDIDLVSAENMLAMAHDGRLMALKRLGLVTAEEVKNGIPYEELLQRIETRMGGTAAAALDTYSGKVKENANIFAAMADSVGTALMPAMDDLENAVTAAYEALQPLVDEFVNFINDNMPAIKAGIDGFAKTLSTLASDVIPAAFHAIETLILDLAKFGQWFGNNSGQIKIFFESTLAVGGVGALFALSNMARVAMVAFGNMALGIDSATGALVAFDAAATVATVGLNLLILGIIVGITELLSHWDTSCSKMSELWRGFVHNIQEGGADFDDVIAGMYNWVANLIGLIPGLNGLANAIRGVAAAEQARANQEHVLASYTAGPTTEDDSEARSQRAATAAMTAAADNQHRYLVQQHKEAADKAAAAAAAAPSTSEIPGTSTAGAKKAKETKEDLQSLTNQYGPAKDAVDKYKDAQTALDNKLKQLDASLDGDRKAVADAMTVQAEATAKAKLAQDTIVELAAKHKLLNDSIFTSTQQLKQLNSELPAAKNQVDIYSNAILTLAKQMNAAGGGTKAQKDALKDLEAQYRQHKITLDDLEKKIAEVTGIRQKDTDAILANSKAQAVNTSTIAEFSRKMDELRIKGQQALADEVNTYGMSTTAMLAYYNDKLAAATASYNALSDAQKAADTEYTAEMEDFQGKVNSLQLQAIKDQEKIQEEALKARQEALKKVYDEEKSMLDTFLDDIVSKHESLKNILADFTKSILKSQVGTLS